MRQQRKDAVCEYSMTSKCCLRDSHLLSAETNWDARVGFSIGALRDNEETGLQHCPGYFVAETVLVGFVVSVKQNQVCGSFFYGAASPGGCHVWGLVLLPLLGPRKLRETHHGDVGVKSKVLKLVDDAGDGVVLSSAFVREAL